MGTGRQTFPPPLLPRPALSPYLPPYPPPTLSPYLPLSLDPPSHLTCLPRYDEEDEQLLQLDLQGGLEADEAQRRREETRKKLEQGVGEGYHTFHTPCDPHTNPGTVTTTPFPSLYPTLQLARCLTVRAPAAPHE